MSQSLSCILIHLVFSTKDRKPWLKESIRAEAHAFLAGCVRKLECEAFRVGGVDDHVHLAVRLSRTLAVADLTKEIKSASSKWIKSQSPSLGEFSWQKGYGAFSLGMSQKNALLHYIENQESHHRKETFQEEFRAFLKKYEVEYDERYVWD